MGNIPFEIVYTYGKYDENEGNRSNSKTMLLTKHGYCRCPHPPIHRGLAAGLCNNDHRFIAPHIPSMG